MEKYEVAWILEEIGDFLEILGENSYRVRAYRKAAHNLRSFPDSLQEIARKRELAKIPGIGKSIEGEIENIIKSGDSQLLKELKNSVPEPVKVLYHLPGVTPAVAGLIHRRLRIKSNEDLKRALAEKAIRGLPGLGAKAEETIRQALLTHETDGSSLLSAALEQGEKMMDRLMPLPDLFRVSLTGETRRGEETVDELGLLAASDEPRALVNFILSFPEVAELLSEEKGIYGFSLKYGLPIRLVICQENEYVLKLIEETGPSEHWQYIIKRIEGRSFQVREGRLLRASGKSFCLHHEEDLYHVLDLPYLIPEVRHRQESAFLDLKMGWHPLEMTDIRGDLHLHTSWSDGGSTLEEMVEKARSLGLEYMAVTDHSPSQKIGRGLTTAELQEQMDYIDELNERGGKPWILKGMEVDINPDGTLDLPDYYLNQLDWVVASVHSSFNMPQKEMTKRVVRAMEDSRVKVLGHPTGRFFSVRRGYEIDMEMLFKVARETGTALEINSSPDRRDLNEEYARAAAESGAVLTLGSDAHNAWQMEFLKYGVIVARRAGIWTEKIINTLPLDKFLEETAK